MQMQTFSTMHMLPRAAVAATRIAAERGSNQPRGWDSSAHGRDRARAQQYAWMDTAFRPTLGTIGSSELVLRMLAHCDQPISTLAHWIVERKVVAFDWQSQTLLPLFQFQLSDMSLRSPVVHVVQELSALLGDWELALWFALPNPWLDQARPVDAISHDAPAVLHAARAARFALR